MLNRTADTTIAMENLEPGSTHSYIVQSISHVEIADNVSPEYSVTATCGQEQDAAIHSELPTAAEEQIESDDAQTSSVISPIIIGVVVIGILACVVAVILVMKKHHQD